MANNHFDLTLDTLAPTGSISGVPGAIIKSNGNLTINKGDASYMKLWFSTSATGSKQDSNYASAAWVAAATSYATKFTADGVYYYHMILKDDVGNESAIIDSAAMKYDTTAPVVNSVSIKNATTQSTAITKDRTNSLTFTFSDAGASASGVVSAVIKGYLSGDSKKENKIVGGPIAVSAFSGEGTHTQDVSFISTAVDGSYVIEVTVTDAAGNTSTAKQSNAIMLDTQGAAGTIILYDTRESNPVPDPTNFKEFKIELDITSSPADVVGYKVWGDFTAPDKTTTITKPSAFTSVTKGTDPIDAGTYHFSSGDGGKTVNAEIIDASGNVTVLTSRTIFYDVTQPVVSSFTVSQTHIADAEEGKTKVTSAYINVAANDAASGIKEVKIEVGSVELYKKATVPANNTVSVSGTNSLSEGNNTIKLTITDEAGNVYTATKNIYYDTTEPTVSVGTLNTWYTDQFDVNVTSSDAGAGVQSLKVWTSTTATDTSVPTTANAIAYSSATQTIAAKDIVWNLAQSASNYVHVQCVDKVGNISFAHKKFGYDNVAPTGSVSFAKAAYNSSSAVINLTNNDATSKVSHFKVTGDITNPSSDWEAITGTKSVTLSTGDGKKNVSVVYKDTAGNQSASYSASCELDTTRPTGTLALYKSDGTTAQPSITNVAEFACRITFSDDTMGAVEYKLYGDFTYNSQGATGLEESKAEWKALTYDSGKQYLTVRNLFCTSNPSGTTEEVKEVYLKLRDNAGNEIAAAVKQDFTYDTGVPTVSVENVDYNRISKVHELRRSNATTTISDKYCDEVHFTITPDEPIQAYRVCAYLDTAAASKGTFGDAAIPTTKGSINMSATGLDSDKAINCTINGADYEAALGEAGKVDGLHYVVVYVQDLGGTWSVAGTFTA
jgi:hypothetical protein